ncbi:MAG: 50S ribosomal protein L2, partial [Candidatus Diapherotrites archaeon]
MPKRLKTQARGKGGPIWLATKNGVAVSRYANFDPMSKEVLQGEVVDLLNDPARTSVLAKILLDNGTEEFIVAAEGLMVGQKIEHGANAKVEIGNVKTLGSCPEGCPVFNIEKH